MDHQRHKGHDAHHGRGQRVDQEPNLKANTSDRRPLVQHAIKTLTGQRLQEDRYRCNERHQHAQNGNAMRVGTANLVAEEAAQNCAQQGSKRHDEVGQLHGLCFLAALTRVSP